MDTSQKSKLVLESDLPQVNELIYLIERANEYHVPIYIAFIDFEKAFDTIEHWAVKHSLINSGIDHRYTDLIANIYKEA